MAFHRPKHAPRSSGRGWFIEAVGGAMMGIGVAALAVTTR